MASKVRRFQPHHLTRTVGLVVVMSFALGYLPGQPVLAQSENSLYDLTGVKASSEDDLNLGCMHALFRRSPGCRAKILLWSVERWLTTQFWVDTAQWGLPVYVELDDADRVQRVSILCVHLGLGRP